MGRHDWESESEYSETDVSYDPPQRRKVVKRRSFSRRRHSPDNGKLLAPVVQAVRRAHSAGGRRRQDPAVVVVDINNDVRARQASRDRREHRHHDVDDIEEIDIVRAHRRPRASSNLTASRTPSPRQQQRDWELVVDQRLLEKNDVRQDMELMKQQQEIERLERQLAKHRERARREPRFAEDDFYEEELSEKLRKLQRLELKKRTDEDRRIAEYREKVRRLEEMERKAAEEEEAKRLAREKYLKELEKKEAIRAEKERIKKELRDEEARKALEEEEAKKARAILKAQAIEEWRRAEEAKKLREIEEKERRDREFKARLKAEFGYDEAQLEAMLKKEKKEEKEKEKEKQALIHSPAREKTTFIKIHRKYLLPETLIAYRLPWDWDERDSNYIIIKTWISEEFQEELFAHTRRLREGKLVAESSTTLTELKVNDRKRDRMYLVRKKDPNRKAWIFA